LAFIGTCHIGHYRQLAIFTERLAAEAASREASHERLFLLLSHASQAFSRLAIFSLAISFSQLLSVFYSQLSLQLSYVIS